MTVHAATPLKLTDHPMPGPERSGAAAAEDIIGRFRVKYTPILIAAEVAAAHTATEGWQTIYREHTTEQRKAKGRIAERLRERASALEFTGWLDEDDDKIVKDLVKEVAALREADASFHAQVVSNIRAPEQEAKRIREQYEFEASKAQERNPLIYGKVGDIVRRAIAETPNVHWNAGPGTITIGHAEEGPEFAQTEAGEVVDTKTGEVKYTVGVDPAKPGADFTSTWVPPEEAAQVLNATGKAPAPLSPTDASVAAIGAVVGVGPAVADDGRDAPSSTWDNRLTIAPHVATKKINPQCGDMLRQAGFAQLNDVQSVRVVYADWRERIRAEVLEKTGYKLTDRQLDGLDEAIEARLSNKGQ